MKITNGAATLSATLNEVPKQGQHLACAFARFKQDFSFLDLHC